MFQRDSARAHTAREAIEFLHEFFGEQLVSLPLWAPRSPDLTPLDFFCGVSSRIKFLSNGGRNKIRICHETQIVCSVVLQLCAKQFFCFVKQFFCVQGWFVKAAAFWRNSKGNFPVRWEYCLDSWITHIIHIPFALFSYHPLLLFRKFEVNFKKIFCNLGDNFTQFFEEFHSLKKKRFHTIFTRISPNF